MDLGAITLLYHVALRWLEFKKEDENLTIILHRVGPRPVQSMLFIFAGILMMTAITLQELIPSPDDKEGNQFWQGYSVDY